MTALRIVVVGLALLLLAAGGTLAWLALQNQNAQEQNQQAAQDPQPEPDPEPETVQVLVVARALERGTLLRPSDWRWEERVAGEVGDGVYEKDSANTAKLSGALVGTDIAEGVPLTREDVVLPAERGFLSAVLDPGEVAVSIAVTDVTSNAGLMFPGDRVNLLYSQAVDVQGDGETRSRYAAQTIVENARLVAMGRRIDATGGDGEGGGTPEQVETVTLAVTPDQAEAVRVAGQSGNLSLALKSLSARRETDLAQSSEGGALREALDGGGNARRRPEEPTWISDVTGAFEPVDDTVLVLAATRSLEAGDILRPGDLHWVRRRSGDVRESMFRRARASRGEMGMPSGTDGEDGMERPRHFYVPVGGGEAVNSARQVFGAILSSSLDEGELLEQDDIVLPSDRGFLSAALSPGKRAVSVSVDRVQSNAGLMFPGDRVDVLLTGEVNKRGFSETVLADVRLIAVGGRVSVPGLDQDSQGAGGDGTVVTLEVAPREAQIVKVAAQRGPLQLTLHSLATRRDHPLPQNREGAPLEPALTADAGERVQAPPAPVWEDQAVRAVPAPSGDKLEVYRGGSR